MTGGTVGAAAPTHGVAVPNDVAVREAVREQTPVVRYAPEAPASRAIRLIARQLNKQKEDKSNFPVQPKSFWESLAGS